MLYIVNLCVKGYDGDTEYNLGVIHDLKESTLKRVIKVAESTKMFDNLKVNLKCIRDFTGNLVYSTNYRLVDIMISKINEI